MISVERVLSEEGALLTLAADMAKMVMPGVVFYLNGDLGAGKTVFARGFIKALGYSGLVKSPTYSLVEPYQIDEHLMCYHFDLYRLSEPEELEFTGSRDYFNAESICLVEWPAKAQGFIPPADIICQLDYHQSGRKITISALSENGESMMLQCFPNELL